MYKPMDYVLNNNNIDYHSKDEGQNLESKIVSLSHFGPVLRPVLCTIQTQYSTHISSGHTPQMGQNTQLTGAHTTEDGTVHVVLNEAILMS